MFILCKCYQFFAFFLVTLSLIYYCVSGFCNNTLDCSHHGYADPKNCSRCLCPDEWQGDFCTDVPQGAQGVCVCVPGGGQYIPDSAQEEEPTLGFLKPLSTARVMSGLSLSESDMLCHWAGFELTTTEVRAKWRQAELVKCSASQSLKLNSTVGVYGILVLYNLWWGCFYSFHFLLVGSKDC